MPENVATTGDIPDVANHVTTGDVENHATTGDIPTVPENVATTGDIPTVPDNIATTGDIPTDYVTSSELDGYVTTGDVGSVGFNEVAGYFSDDGYVEVSIDTDTRNIVVKSTSSLADAIQDLTSRVSALENS